MIIICLVENVRKSVIACRVDKGCSVGRSVGFEFCGGNGGAAAIALNKPARTKFLHLKSLKIDELCSYSIFS